ncbi:CopD family protein [Paenibacillus sp. y28]|uniref:CopD family protein n=1 Tax=Paenibacillus sp. y28 TaxID=3129110 RepID=UPI003016FFE1
MNKRRFMRQAFFLLAAVCIGSGLLAPPVQAFSPAQAGRMDGDIGVRVAEAMALTEPAAGAGTPLAAGQSGSSVPNHKHHGGVGDPDPSGGMGIEGSGISGTAGTTGTTGTTGTEHQHEDPAPGTSAESLLRLVALVMVIVLGGLLTFRHVMWGGEAEAIPSWSTRQAERGLLLSGILVFAATGAGSLWLLGSQLSAGSAGSPGPGHYTLKLLSGTLAGAVAWLRPFITALLLVLAYAPEPAAQQAGAAAAAGRILTAARMLLLGGLLLTFAWSGPAASAASASAALVPALAHTLHLGAAAVWIGGLTGISMLSYSLVQSTAALLTMQRLLSRFAAVALPVLLLAGLSGLLLSVVRIRASDGELLASTYGQLLLWKVLLVGAAAGLGAFHRYSLMPRLLRLQAGGGTADRQVVHGLFLSIRLELLLAAMIIGFGAFLAPSAAVNQRSGAPEMSLQVLTIGLQTEPQTIRSGQPVELSASVQEGSGGVANAKVELELWPEGGKHETIPAAERQTGVYAAAHRFTVPGTYEVLVHVTTGRTHQMITERLTVLP